MLFSGAASLINEVVWQRAFKRFLGGSETLSSMLVVAAFMFGLGVGSLVAGRMAQRLRRPIRTLVFVEVLLAALTLTIALGLASGGAQKIIELQLLAVRAGIPVMAAFVGLAGVVLSAPCFLMGATMPLASECSQRALGHTDSRALGKLFAVNTFGAALGAMTASYLLVPLIGISSSLYSAVALNFVAALIFATRTLPKYRYAARACSAQPVSDHSPSGPPSVRVAAITMLVLGFCSLGYEMALFRLFALARGPMPYTFAIVITGFLIAWSAGAALSSHTRRRDFTPMLGACIGALFLPIAAYYHWWVSAAVEIQEAPWALARAYQALGLVLPAGCFLPCVLFGYLFGAVTARSSRRWGRDVGDLYAANTMGAVSGALAVPLWGYEIPLPALILALAAILLALRHLEQRVAGSRDARGIPSNWPRGIGRLLAAGAAGAFLAAGISGGKWLNARMSLFFSRDGVLGVDRHGSFYRDGLWHSEMAQGASYIGTNNWNMAAMAALGYSGPAIRNVCVIGLGTGITAAVIAQLETVRRVDVYEIDRGLEPLHRRYPDGTLRSLENPKLRILWQDARAGLVIRSSSYDLIITQPLYLAQAGSSFLNSREFFEIARSRLAPNGVFCVYSRGTPAQKLVMRQTAASVFPHGESFFDGYLLVLSSEPLDISGEALDVRFSKYRDDRLWREIAANSETVSPVAVRSILDVPRLNWSDTKLVVSDDDPIIEYPWMLETRLKRASGTAK